MENRLASDVDLLEVHRETSFTFDERGRMVHENAPDRTRGSRFSLAGCRDGNVVVIRDDVPEVIAAQLRELAENEPPLFEPDVAPRHADDYVRLLHLDETPATPRFGLCWTFPELLTYDHDVALVWSNSREGARLLAAFDDVMPRSLTERGFRTPDSLWQPWCVALIEDQVASIAATVRSGPRGVEVGLDTAKERRGRGLGAAATSGWSDHPQLAGRAKFYGTSRENTASRHVTERLALPFLGSTFGAA